jgi:hypothetical protein
MLPVYHRIIPLIESEELARLLKQRIISLNEEIIRLKPICLKYGQELKGSDGRDVRNYLKNFTVIENATGKSVMRDVQFIMLIQKTEFAGISIYRAIGELCDSIGLYKLGELLDESLADKENFCHELMDDLKDINNNLYRIQ